MGKFLDLNGIKYLWGKIKEKFIPRGGVKTDDIIDGNVTKSKLSTDVQTSLNKVSNALLKDRENVSSGSTIINVEDASNGIGIILNDDQRTIIRPGSFLVQAQNACPISYEDGKVCFYDYQMMDYASIEYATNDGNPSIMISSSIGSSSICGISEPINDMDAANKNYVDTQIGKLENRVTQNESDIKQCTKTNEDANFNNVHLNGNIYFEVTGKENCTIDIHSTGVDGELEFGSEVDCVKLKNISDPEDEQDAATKNYVDKLNVVKIIKSTSLTEITLASDFPKTFIVNYNNTSAILIVNCLPDLADMNPGSRFTFIIGENSSVRFKTSLKSSIESLANMGSATSIWTKRGPTRVELIYTGLSIPSWYIYEQAIS